jgi:hypothetical protein
MLVNYTHSRAAILCFGGWGLQVMLHLAARIHAAQELRAALHAGGPDLSRATSFGAALAEPLLSADGFAQFYMHRPQPDRTWAPYYVENLLVDLERNPPLPADERADPLLTAAERRATRLQRAAEPALQPLRFSGYDFRSPARGASALHPNAATAPQDLRRASRHDIFRMGLHHADPASRLIETYLLDPIRQDNLAPDDPFVQTTLYVVAPLFEPLTSALIWPLVSGVMARMGRRHVSTVVALLATGSYATDLTRPIEDASAHAALAELEILAGLRKDPRAQAALTAQIQESKSPLAEYVGENLFDHIYLLDREKSNQGLAEDSHDLAVLAANALEALVIGSGDLYIQ